ncbi:MAG: hypothetical protein PHS93_09570 [Candidatus Omnitrophica bacterium]|nr:hypothetical protein [Candidatus Omnitrophota bacterium]
MDLPNRNPKATRFINTLRKAESKKYGKAYHKWILEGSIEGLMPESSLNKETSSEIRRKINKFYFESPVRLSPAKIAKKFNKTPYLIGKQVILGRKIEMEHTKDPKVARKIALDHLWEDPEYYTKPKPVNWAEKELEKEGKKSYIVNIEGKEYPVTTLKEASERYINAIETLDIGASQTPQGLVYKDGSLIGYIAYNGRIFEGKPEDWSKDTKILYESREGGIESEKGTEMVSKGEVQTETIIEPEVSSLTKEQETEEEVINISSENTSVEQLKDLCDNADKENKIIIAELDEDLIPLYASYGFEEIAQ